MMRRVTRLPPLGFDSFEWCRAPWGPALRCTPLADHLFSTRALVLDRDGRAEGWGALAAAMGVAPDRVVRLSQVHGAAAVVVRSGDRTRPGTPGPEADIAACGHPGHAVVVQVADCVPVLLADARTGVVAAAHVGWRGLAAGAPGAAVAVLARAFGAQPADLVAALGPSIGPCCYEVGPEVRERVVQGGVDPAAAACWFRPGRAARFFLDLWQAVSDQLVQAGVPEDRVHACRLCTATYRHLFYSYRAEGAGTGRLVGIIRPSRPGGAGAARPRPSPDSPGGPRPGSPRGARSGW